MTYAGVIVLGVLVFATGLLVGASVALEHATKDIRELFADTEQLRNENKWLRERICAHKGGMPAYDGTRASDVIFDETCGVMGELRL